MPKKIIITLILATSFFYTAPTRAAQILFTPSLTLSEKYTDNLYLEPDNQEDDFITTTGLDLTGSILWRTTGISLNYNPSYNAYSQNSDLNNWRHLAALNIWKDFTRATRLELQNTYLQTNDPVDASPIPEPINISVNGVPLDPVIGVDKNRRGRREYFTNVAQATLTHKFGADDSIYAAYQHSTREDIDAPAQMQSVDNSVSTPSMGLIYNFTPRWGVESDVSYAAGDYSDRTDRDEFNGNFRLLHHFTRVVTGYVHYRHTILNYSQDTDEDYQVYAPSIGIRYGFRDNARIEAAVGYYIQDLESSDGNEGFNITSNIYKRWVYRAASFGVSGGSGYVIDDNGVEDNGLNIYYQIGMDAGYNFTRNLSGTVYGTYRYDDYPNEPLTRFDETTSAGLRFNYQALRWMVVGLSYNFITINSSSRTDEYIENSALLTVSIYPPTPYRFN